MLSGENLKNSKCLVKQLVIAIHWIVTFQLFRPVLIMQMVGTRENKRKKGKQLPYELAARGAKRTIAMNVSREKRKGKTAIQQRCYGRSVGAACDIEGVEALRAHLRTLQTQGELFAHFANEEYPEFWIKRDRYIVYCVEYARRRWYMPGLNSGYRPSTAMLTKFQEILVEIKKLRRAKERPSSGRQGRRAESPGRKKEDARARNPRAFSDPRGIRS
jgi:hypothetical protein